MPGGWRRSMSQKHYETEPRFAQAKRKHESETGTTLELRCAL